MSEVTSENFKESFKQIEADIRAAKFVAIDAEFSALLSSEQHRNSLFDTPAERYDKLRKNASEIIPVQIGISAFLFDPDKNAYTAKAYTFYIFPRSFSNVNTNFLCNSTTLQFLCNHKFDFNKFIYSGIPFLNRLQENEIRNQLKTQTFQNIYSADEFEFENLIEEERDKIVKWYYNANNGDSLEIEDFVKKYSNNYDMAYCFHTHLRKRFKNTLWTYEENNKFKVKKVMEEEFAKLCAENNLEETQIENMLGFTRVFRLLSECKKPIVGHNLLMDLLLLINYFEQALPTSYVGFKKLVLSLFYKIFDTKTLSFNLHYAIPKDKKWSNASLKGLYAYFKDGSGRHMAQHSPLIQIENFLSEEDHFHDAGWDSYCTGYIFIRMAHIFAQSKYEKPKKFMSSELVHSIEEYKNAINVIRCSVSHIVLDGADPPSTRPPCLTIETIQNKPININEIVAQLSSYGFIEVKPFTKRKALIAVDNKRSATKILEQYAQSKELQVKICKSTRLPHAANFFILGSAIVTGAFLAWLARSSLKK